MHDVLRHGVCEILLRWEGGGSFPEGSAVLEGARFPGEGGGHMHEIV